VIADTGTQAWTTVEAELISVSSRVDGAVRTASIMEEMKLEGVPFDYAFDQTISAWDEPPITINETTSLTIQKSENGNNPLAHTSPGMMLPICDCRAVDRGAGHCRRAQVAHLATPVDHRHAPHPCGARSLSGDIRLDLHPVHDPDHIRSVRVEGGLPASAECDHAGGVLRGVMYLCIGLVDRHPGKNRRTSRYLFAGADVRICRLGGAWVPLEVTGATFQAIGHLSPIAWGMDGFENICARGLGFESVLIPSAALACYGLLFFVLAVWRLNASEEK